MDWLDDLHLHYPSNPKNRVQNIQKSSGYSGAFFIDGTFPLNQLNQLNPTQTTKPTKNRIFAQNYPLAYGIGHRTVLRSAYISRSIQRYITCHLKI